MSHRTLLFRDGVLLLVNSFAPKIDILKTDTKGRFIIFRVANTSDVVVVLYAPSGILKEKQELRQNILRTLRKQIRSHTTRKDNVILLGDFNNTLKDINRSTNNLGEKEAKSELLNLIQQLDLEDHWRLQNPNEKLYVHYHGRKNTYARIDRAYTNFDAVFLEGKNQVLNRGKGYWILNKHFWK